MLLAQKVFFRVAGASDARSASLPRLGPNDRDWTMFSAIE